MEDARQRLQIAHLMRCLEAEYTPPSPRVETRAPVPALPPSPATPKPMCRENDQGDLLCADCEATTDSWGRPIEIDWDTGHALCDNCRACRRPGGY